jgi:ATP-dependent DNA ligase
MADIRIMKAVEFSKLAAAFKKRWGNEQALYQAGWFAQPKFDGCYGEFHIDKRQTGAACFALTRTGEIIQSCNHILQDLWNRSTTGAVTVYVGELWCEDHLVLFPEISGWVRRHYDAPKLCLKVFDVLPDGLNTTEQYRLRYERAYELIGSTPSTAVSIAPLLGKNVTDINLAAGNLKAQGKYDGAILRDPDAGYKVGLVKRGEIVKVKPVMSLDLTIVGLMEEAGEKTGRAVYTLSVTHNGVVSDVGSGMPHKLPADMVLGAIAEIECMGLTEDGKLREPRFKGIRHDKEQPD